MKNVTWKSCFKVGTSAFLLFLCIYYWKTISGVLAVAVKAATPILIGLVIAYVLNILMAFYERHYFPRLSSKKFISRTRRGVCLVGAIITLAGIIVLIGYLVVPELFSCIKFLLAEIPLLINKMLKSEWLGNLLPADIISQLASVDWMSYATKVAETLTAGLSGAVGAVVSALTSVVSVIVTVFISLIFSIYLLYGKNTLKRQSVRLFNSYLPEKIYRKLMRFFSVLDECFHKYVVGQCIEAVILGLLCTLGMLIFRFPYAGMVGALVGFTALIPIAGAYIGAGVGALMMLTQSPIKALLFLVFIVVLQQIEGNFIYPKVVGNSIGLPAIWVFAAVIVGGGLFGVIGLLAGVPITAALYRIIRDDLHDKEKRAEVESEIKSQEA